MKRNLILAVSVLALAAVSKPLFAAEAETPAPTEAAPTAAPTAERAAPTRARPAARQRQAAPERQAAPARTTTGGQQQASNATSSYTGVQAGGFGGGNVGGGGFADPICLTGQGSFGSSFGGLNSGCTPAPFSQSLTKSGGIGGATV